MKDKEIKTKTNFLKKIVWIPIFIIMCQCNNEYEDKIIPHNIQGITLYEIKCEGRSYFSLEKGDCPQLPKSYFAPIGDSDYYYSISFRNKNGTLEVFSINYDLVKRGNLDSIRIREYKDYRDNIFFNDSIMGKEKDFYIISGYAPPW